MTLQQLQTALGFLTQEEELGFELYAVMRNDGSLKRIDLGDGELLNEIKQGFIDYVVGRTLQNEEATVMEISALEENLSAIHHYNLEDRPEGLEVIAEEITPEETDNFSFDDDSLENIEAFLVKISSADNHIVLYKNHSHLNLLKQKNGVFLLRSFTGDEERFVKPTTNILRFSFTIDFLLVQGQLFVYDLKCLQREFNFDKIIVNSACDRVNEIMELGFIENIEELAGYAGDKRGAKKILKLNMNSPVLQMEFGAIRTFVENHAYLRRRLQFSEAGNQFRLHSKVSRDYIIQLLNDDFLTSGLTQQDYQSNKKDVLEDEEEG